MHSARMTMTDTMSPTLPPGMDTLTLEEQHLERLRLRAGTLKKLSRVILFSPTKPFLDPSSFSVVPVEQLKELPPDVTAAARMSFSARTEVRLLEYRAGLKNWRSSIFARLEERE